MRILVTSDLHLSDRIWRHRAIEGDSYHSWHQIVDLAISERVHAVILAGDVLDKQQNLSAPVQHLLEGITELSKEGIRVLYNQGKHEFQAQPWISAGPGTQWLQLLDYVTPKGWVISGCDYQNADNLQTFLKSFRAKAADILVCHQVWKDFMGEVGKPQGEFADIPENVKLLITGDYHEHICQQFGKLTVLSPGSTHMRSITEPEDHFVFLLELGSREEKPKIKSLELFTRRCIWLIAKSFKSEAALDKRVKAELESASEYAAKHNFPDQLRMPLIHLTHHVDDNELVNRFQTRWGSAAHLFFKQVTNHTTEEDKVVDYLDASDRVSMLSCLDQFLDPQTQPLSYSLALALVQSPDPEQTLHRWIKEQTSADNQS